MLIHPREGYTLHTNYQTRSMSPLHLQAPQKLIRKHVCAGGGRKHGHHLSALLGKELYQGGIRQQTADCYSSFSLPQINQLIKLCLLPIKTLSVLLLKYRKNAMALPLPADSFLRNVSRHFRKTLFPAVK